MLKTKLALAGAALLCATSANALNIVLNDTGGVTAGTDAYRGFRAAADFWQSLLVNDVTVVLNVGFASTGFSSPNVIGSTGSSRFTGVTVDDFYNQLRATGSGQLDAIARRNEATRTQTASVYGGTTGAVSAITQKAKANGQGVVQNTRVAAPGATTPYTLSGIETVSNREWDNDGSRNNYDLSVNAAVLKAIGYDLPDAIYATRDAQGRGVDGTVRFNSAFNFDFDARDGIGNGQTDFVGTAIHEIGHALGFVSGVDTYDANSNATVNFDNRANMSTLDLFRYSNDPTNVAPGSGPVLDWSVGNVSNAVRPYFSFDGGKTNGLAAWGGTTGEFSTGANFGDGRQASHWVDTPYEGVPGRDTAEVRCVRPIGGSRGIMDPTFGPCEVGAIRALDLAAFDAMGWNLGFNVLRNTDLVFYSGDALNGIAAVPEPGTWATMLLGFGLVGAGLRRRRVALAA